MPRKAKPSAWLAASAVLASTTMASPAAAYIGPGAGLSAIGTVAALAGAVLLLVIGFVWYPVKRLLRRRKTAGAEKKG